MVRANSIVPFILVIVAVILAAAHPTTARNNRTLCRVVVSDLVSKCAKFAQGSGPVTNPSQDCCRVIKDTDIGCACKRVNWFIERIVNMKKAIFVARSCGLKLQAGTKCGSFKIPPM
ncbi:hypothetical protein QQ045_033165 [Rhodiola kirilowii]